MPDLHAPVATVHSDARTPRLGLLPVDEDELVACVACGLCLPHCPTYRVTGLEVASPRGRIAAMRAVEFDGVPFDGAFRDAMEACVQCRGCEAACPSGVPFGHLMEGARTALGRRAPAEPRAFVRRGSSEWVGYAVVLPRHRLLLALTWLAAGSGNACDLVPRRLGLPRLSRTSLRTPLRGDAHPDALPLHRLRDGRVATRRPPRRARGHARGRSASRSARARRRLLRCAAHARGARRRSPAARPSGDHLDARRRARRRRQRRLRRGDEGLRPAARHRRRARVLGSGARLLASGSPRSLRSRSATPADASSCRTRATSGTCSAPSARVRAVLAPRLPDPRDRRRRPLLRRRWRVRRAPTGAGERDPRPQGRRDPRRRGEAGARGRRRPIPGARCTSRPPASTCATPPSCSPRRSRPPRSTPMLEAEHLVERLRVDRGGPARPRLRPAAGSRRGRRRRRAGRREEGAAGPARQSSGRSSPSAVAGSRRSTPDAATAGVRGSRLSRRAAWAAA